MAPTSSIRWRNVVGPLANYFNNSLYHLYLIIVEAMWKARIRDWSKIVGGGERATKRERGGACEVLPLQKWGGRKTF